MRVACVCQYKENNKVELTRGKVYEAAFLELFPARYTVVNDLGESKLYLCENFVELLEEPVEAIETPKAKQVRCVSNCNGLLSLTLDKLYDLVTEDNELYQVCNDDGDLMLYSHCYFIKEQQDCDPAPSEPVSLLSELYEIKSNIGRMYAQISGVLNKIDGSGK